MVSNSRGSGPVHGASPQQAYNFVLRKPLPYLQVAEAAIAIDANCTLDRLTALLDAGDRTPSQHAADVAEVVKVLIDDRLLVMSDPGLFATPEHQQLRRSEGLARVIDRPLQLGPPLRDIYADTHTETMRQTLRRLEVKAPSRKADMVEAVVAALGDPDFVRSVVAAAPTTTRELLFTIARGEEDEDSRFALGGLAGFDYERYRQEQAARSWAVQHGLMVGGYSNFNAVMPSEVALALLGPDARAPFTPIEPPLLVRPVSTDLVTGHPRHRRRRHCACSAGRQSGLRDVPGSEIHSCGGVGRCRRRCDGYACGDPRSVAGAIRPPRDGTERRRAIHIVGT